MASDACIRECTQWIGIYCGDLDPNGTLKAPEGKAFDLDKINGECANACDATAQSTSQSSPGVRAGEMVLNLAGRDCSRLYKTSPQTTPASESQSAYSVAFPEGVVPGLNYTPASPLLARALTRSPAVALMSRAPNLPIQQLRAQADEQRVQLQKLEQIFPGVSETWSYMPQALQQRITRAAEQIKQDPSKQITDFFKPEELGIADGGELVVRGEKFAYVLIKPEALAKSAFYKQSPQFYAPVILEGNPHFSLSWARIPTLRVGTLRPVIEFLAPRFVLP